MIDHEKYDRALQKRILEELYNSSPQPMSADLKSSLETEAGSNEKFTANILYLVMHDLITDPYDRIVPLLGKVTFIFSPSHCVIKAKGIDFLLADGGLGAILNVQTIKFHRDAVVVLEDLIALSGMNDADKEKAKSKLSELTTESLKTVVQTITTAGLAVLMK